MHKRCIATTLLAAVLLFSQGGTLLVAALCPHLQPGMASCETQPAGEAMSHEGMGHAGHMEMEPEPAFQTPPDAFALGQPNDQCSHCAVHSGSTPNTASLKQAKAVSRLIDLNIPFQVYRVTPVAASPVPGLTSRAHGPPGEQTPRHILINIFRI